MLMPALRIVVGCLIALLLAACGRIQVQPAGPPVQEPELRNAAAVMADGYRLPIHRWVQDRAPDTVVLGLHGFGDYGQAYAALKEALVDTGLAAVYAYDQRGFGATERPGIWAGGETLAADLHAVVELLRQRYPDARIVLVAESMGGAVTLRALANDPVPDVDGVILLAPAVWGEQTMPWYQRLGLAVMLRIAPGATFSGDAVADLGIRPTDDPEVIEALRRDPMVQKEARVDTLHGVTELMTEVFDGPARFPVPTLLLYGLRDQVIPPGPVCEWLGRVSATEGDRFRMVLYPDGYHMLTRYLGATDPLTDIAAWLENSQAGVHRGAEVDLEQARNRICALPSKGLRERRRR
ncbi:Lysophospholipase [Thioalkalivibrio nitratireducens DSM 14787]|uniref:Lysophospholipase n=2 Tax=Thioalkalivibrio nitratireducens TaxID=186931 RepID=L0DVJ7_THIND|nr:Lysophospholipase [Thioalkalivibrio nitratireducens DSM 14787]